MKEVHKHVPMLFPSSVHWLIWGKRRISFHFLLLPFLFPPPPVVTGKTRGKNVQLKEINKVVHIYFRQ